MIEVTYMNGRRHFLTSKVVARVIETNEFSQRPGIKAFAKLFDGGPARPGARPHPRPSA